jgi:site-specific DNA recombinase
MKRAALYARYSSDLQSDRSIEDQFAVCRQRAERDGHQVVASFEDRARSGASVFGRPGLAQMIEAAKGGSFDVLVVEALDRISRDQEDMASIFKRLSFQGVEIVTVHEGRADAIQVGIRGIVSSLFLTDLANKVRRGAAGNIREGKHAGGLAYGYRPTPGKPGEWVVHEEEAETIRRIFDLYIAGDRSRDIAAKLNADRIPPPRGAYWRGNTLTGSNNRHNGIIGNEIYAGQLVWNRVRMIKNPDTGKRVSRPNPEAEWHRTDVPALRIIDPEIFATANAIRLGRGHASPAMRRKPKHMLSGLLRCGSCGAGMSVKGADRGGTRIICTRFHESKACDNQRTYYLHKVEQTLLSGLRRHLVDPSAIKLFLKTYHDERKRLAADGVNIRAKLERDLAEVERKIERATTALLTSTAAVQTFVDAINALEIDKRELQSRLTEIAAPIKVVALHPAAQAQYLAAVENLSETITNRGATSETAMAVRELIETVTVKKTPPGAPIDLHVKGRLAALLQEPMFPEGSMSGGGAVAGSRYQKRKSSQLIAFIRARRRNFVANR